VAGGCDRWTGLRHASLATGVLAGAGLVAAIVLVALRVRHDRGHGRTAGRRLRVDGSLTAGGALFTLSRSF
jgi:hypothetical protein